MKVGIITFHFVANQGGVLQCFATQKFLEKNGHEPYVIDYRPSYHTVRYAAVKNPFIYSRGFWRKFEDRKLLKRIILTLRSFARCVYMNIKHTDTAVEKCYSAFIDCNLRLTRRYPTLKALRNSPPVVDAMISGSDQLWSPELLDRDFDEAYFLKFGADTIPKITYAVSTGMELDEKFRKKLPNLCSDLTAISMREYSEESVKAIGKDVHICIDPTLLLDADDYASAECGLIEAEPYIFVYGFETTEELKAAVELAEKKYNCQIINGTPHRIILSGNVKKVRDYGPDQFLTYIKNATCVVTNSFHGTAFSLIYKKDFITVAHSTRGRRMTDLLGKIGADSRLYGTDNFNFDSQIDYVPIYEKLREVREHSAEYLMMALDGKTGEQIPHYMGETYRFPVKERPLYREIGGKLFPETYAVKHKNSLIRSKSRSGGIFTALTDKALERGWVVYGCFLDQDHKAVHMRAASKEERDLMRGSKYVQSNLGNTFRQVKEDLTCGRGVVFSGTPCQVDGLLNYLGKKYETLITVDIVCHGVPSPKVWKDYIKWQENRKKDIVQSVDFRNKVNYGWTEHVETLYLESGRRIDSRVYNTLFYGHNILRPSCYNCRYKTTMRVSDITIGDYWGIDKAKPGFNDNKGVSLVLINSNSGKILFEEIKDSVICEKTKLEDSLQQPLTGNYAVPDGRDTFWDFYNSSDFADVAKRYGRHSVKGYWKNFHLSLSRRKRVKQHRV